MLIKITWESPAAVLSHATSESTTVAQGRSHPAQMLAAFLLPCPLFSIGTAAVCLLFLGLTFLFRGRVGNGCWQHGQQQR